VKGEKSMSFRPFSWFSDWADKLGIPVWVLIVAAVVVGAGILGFLSQGCQS
jgi:hypothetical protein